MTQNYQAPSTVKDEREDTAQIIFFSENIEQLCTKRIAQPIPRTQHRPIIYEIDTAISGIEVLFRRRYNFKKSKWENFTNELENIITTIEPTPSEYDHFIKKVKIVSRKHIPRVVKTI